VACTEGLAAAKYARPHQTSVHPLAAKHSRPRRLGLGLGEAWQNQKVRNMAIPMSWFDGFWL